MSIKGSELPPTADDKKLSTRHHVDSVAYNLRHAQDHFAAIPDHLARMRETGGPEMTLRSARKAAAALAKMQAELAPYIGSTKSSRKEETK